MSASRRFGVAHCDAEDAAEELAREIRERYPESDVMIVECGPRSARTAGRARWPSRCCRSRRVLPELRAGLIGGQPPLAYV